MRLILVERPDGMADRRDDRRRVDGRANHDAASRVADLVALFVHAIDRGLQLVEHAALADRLHDADDRVPVALLARFPNLNLWPSGDRSREMPIRERLVDDRDGSVGLPIGGVEESPSRSFAPTVAK